VTTGVTASQALEATTGELFWVFSDEPPNSGDRSDTAWYRTGEGMLEVYRNGIKLVPDYLANGDFNTGSAPAAADVGDYHEVATGTTADSERGVAGIAPTVTYVDTYPTGYGPSLGRWIQFYAGREPQVGEVITFRVVQPEFTQVSVPVPP